MRKLQPHQFRAWTLPLVAAALIGPPIVAFAIGGPPLGLAIGALTVTALIVIAARARFDEAIEVATSRADRYGLLVVADVAVEDPEVAGEIGEIARAGVRALGGEPDVVVLAPALNSRLAQWLSDLEEARFEAQRRLAISVGTLAAAGLDARGIVGDADPVQAVEDALRTFPAHELVFLTAPDGGDEEVAEVRRRLDRPVRRLTPTAV
jgi:hypothetical protein